MLDITNDIQSLIPRPRQRDEGIRQGLEEAKQGRRGQQERFSQISKPSMAYRVNITARAERDLELLFGHLNAEGSDAALEWYRGSMEAILRLEEQPNRCPAKADMPRRREAKQVEVLKV